MPVVVAWTACMAERQMTWSIEFEWPTHVMSPSQMPGVLALPVVLVELRGADERLGKALRRTLLPKKTICPVTLPINEVD
jgi:hypothetical protein